MKLTKNWKRIFAGFMAGIMLFLSVDTGAMAAFAAEISETENSKITVNDFSVGGLLPIEAVEVDFDEVGEVYDYEALSEIKVFSNANENEWMRYSTKYYYNQLDDEWKKVWDALDVLMLSKLTSDEESNNDEYITTPENTTLDDLRLFIELYMESNPQFYFLRGGFSYYTYPETGNYSFSIKLYDDFANYQDRADATEFLNGEINSAIESIDEILEENYIQITEQDKLLEIYKYIIALTEYNYDIIDNDEKSENSDITEREEQEWHTQNIYSVFKHNLTVCAGYAEAMQLLCNAFDIDAINVTSSNHKWNKVRINDCWYNVDATWGDAGEDFIEENGEDFAVWYRYYGRSDEAYLTDNANDATSHILEGHWENYVPLCVQDSVSIEPDSNNPDWVPRDFYEPQTTVATPEITVLKTGNNTYTVSIFVPSEQVEDFKDAVIYYTLDGTTPSCASTKSYIYAGVPFTVEGDYSIKAVAVMDGYWDSEIAVEEKIKSVTNLIINDHFYHKMTFQWGVLEEATGYVLDIYKNSEKIKTELIDNNQINSYTLDTSSYELGANVYFEICSYVNEVWNVSEVAVSQICKTKSQPLSAKVKWHVSTINEVTYLVLDVEQILDGNAALQDEMWIWYYSDVNQVDADASFKIDVSEGKNSFMYTLSEHGIPFDETGYLYVTNADKSSAFQETPFAVGGEFVEPELLPIEDKVAETAGETIALQAQINPETKMDNFQYTYQWYVAENELATGTAIEGATDSVYELQIGSYEEKFYYCKVTAEYETKHVYTTSNGTVLETGEQEHTRVSGESFGSEVTILPIEDQVYTGEAILPELTIIDLNTENVLIKDVDYTVSYGENVNVKENVEISVQFIGDYVNANNFNEAKVFFDIVPKNTQNNDSIRVFEADNVIYSGNAFTPNGEVWDLDREVKLVENVDYKLSYSGNTNAGPATVAVTFMGNYTGIRFVNFMISPKDITNEDVTVLNNGSKTYTGYSIVPNLVLKYGDKTLEQGKDFELECSNNVNVGTANVTIRFIGNYTGSKENITFTITKRSADEVVINSILDQEYTGYAITPALSIVYSNGENAVVLEAGTDYSATYTNNINKGTATVALEFKGNFTGTRTVQFEIVSRSAENVTSEQISPVTYTGEALEPKPVIKNGNFVLVEGEDYDLSYADNVIAGENTATVTAIFKGNYYGTKVMRFTILPRDAENCKIEFAIPNQVYSYNGKEHTPDVIVKDGEKLLEKDTDYTVKYENNKNVGKADVIVNFKGNYTGSKTEHFSIISKSITAADLILEGLEDIQEFIYNGLEHTPEITIKDKSLGELLRQGVDYAIEFVNNIMAGIATIRIEFLSGGNYIGETIELFFNIKARTTEHVVISDIPEQRYTGSAITPELEIKDTEANITLVKNQDYTVEYKNNIKEGTATVVVSFKGNFVGEPMTKTFTIINPVPTTITSHSFHVNQSNGYISKVTVGTTANALWSGLNEKDYVVIYDKNGAVVSGSTVIGTGMTAVIMDEGTAVKRYTIVVTGDTNGDGKINITDMIAVKACTLKKSGLSGAYEKAGDVNGDGKINITDFIKVKATTLKKDTITGVEVK